MSTIKSDSENLTLNAHGSGNDIKFQSNSVEVGSLTAEGVMTSTTFAGSGASLTALPAAQLTGTVADARISTLTASKLSGALPAISAANLTSIPAANITGTLPAISGANLTGISSDYKLLSTTTCSNTNNVVITLDSNYPTNKILLSGIVMVNNNDNLRLSVGKGASGTNYTLAGLCQLNRFVYSSGTWTEFSYSVSGAVTFANDLSNNGARTYNAELIFDEGWFDVTQRPLVRGSSTQIGSSDVLEYTLIAMQWSDDNPNTTNNVRIGGNAGGISEGVIKHYGVK